MGGDDDAANALLIRVERKTLLHERGSLLLPAHAYYLLRLILPGLLTYLLIRVVPVFLLLPQACRHFRMVLPGLILRLLGILRGGARKVLHDLVCLTLRLILGQGMPCKAEHQHADHRTTDLPRQRQRVHTPPLNHDFGKV